MLTVYMLNTAPVSHYNRDLAEFKKISTETIHPFSLFAKHAHRLFLCVPCCWLELVDVKLFYTFSFWSRCNTFVPVSYTHLTLPTMSPV